MQHPAIEWFRLNKSKHSYSMNQLYKTIGISKQAVHQQQKRQLLFDENVRDLLLEVEELRAEHPGCGVEKMYATLQPEFIGRDRFIALMMDLGFRLTKKRAYRKTTYSTNIYYPNLIKGLKVTTPSKIWQTDITYYDLIDKFCYIVFIIDVFTKKIIGHQVSDHLRATANIKALKMAFRQNKAPEIHHSDRGSQYVCKKYIELLEQNDCKISMALCAMDNAYAERINKTIKEEYLYYWKPKTFKQLKAMVNKAVKHYNNSRPHNHLGKLSPAEYQLKWNNNQLENFKTLTIFDNNQLIKNGQH